MTDNATTSDNVLNRWIVPLVFLISFVVFYITALPLMDDSDVPWHLAAGRLLLETHRVPTTDPWSFASNGAPWYLLSWVWDLALGIVERFCGVFGVLIFTLSLCAALMAFLTSRLLRLRIAPPAMYLTLMLAGLSMMDFITARPHLAGYGLAMVFHALLHGSRTSGRYGRLLWLPPLMLLWANMHGSFIAGFVILAAYLVEAFWTKNHGWLRRLVIISAACGIGALITPYGTDIITGAMRTLGGGAKKYTLEWLPFAFTISAGVSTWLMVFIMSSNIRIKTVPFADKILAFAWLLATMFVMRNGAIFILLSAPYLAACLDYQTQDLRKSCTPSAIGRFMEKQTPRRVWLACMVAFGLFVVAANALPHEDKILSENASVSDAVDFAMEHYPMHHYLTDFNFGGQVIYRTHGKLPMFMDSRAATAYSEQAMEDYIDFMWQRPGWQEHMHSYGVNGIIIGNGSKFAESYASGQFQGQWQLVFAGKRANVYIARP